MAKVILTNVARGAFVATLYHELFCRRAGKCACRNDIVAGPSGKPIIVRQPASVRIPALTSSEPLPAEVLVIPQVSEAVRRRDLLRQDVVEMPAETPHLPRMRTATRKSKTE